MAMSRVSACRCPPDSSPTGWDIRSSSPMPSNFSFSAKSSLSFFVIRLNGAFPWAERRYASARFSSMVIEGAVPRMGSWNSRPMTLLRLWSGANVMSRPSSVMEPLST